MMNRYRTVTFRDLEICSITRATIPGIPSQRYCQTVWRKYYPNGCIGFRLGGSGPNQTSPDGQHHGVRAVVNVQFPHDIPQVHFDGVLANREPGGNLFVA